MTDDVFNQGEDSGQTQQETPEKFFDHLVGEGKKFKTPEELARGKWESDSYIQTLEREKDRLKEELDKRLTASEIADQIQSAVANREASNQRNTNSGENANTDDPQTTTTQPEGLSQEELLKLLDQRLEERETKTKAQRNREEVSRTLNEKVGATANKWLQDRAKDLGVSVQYLQQQAEVSPKAFYNLVGLNQSQGRTQGFNPPASSVNTASTLDNGTQERTNSYYEKLFQQNPKLRFDAKTTVQMHKDAQRLGPEKFFGN